MQSSGLRSTLNLRNVPGFWAGANEADPVGSTLISLDLPCGLHVARSHFFTGGERSVVPQF
jgi:hypothetical protein